MGSLARCIVDDLICEMADSGIEFDKHFGLSAEEQEMKKVTMAAMEKDVDDLLEEFRGKFSELVQYAVENGGTLRNRHNFWIMVSYLKGIIEK